jgi:hypothetical protein
VIPNENLESLIRRYIVLGPLSPTGFETVKCAVCNDYKIRGGFKFDGDTVFYSCFNCSCKAGYDPEKSRHSITAKMKDVLLSFGIPEAEITRTIAFNFFKERKEVAVKESSVPKSTELPTKESPLPKGSVLVTSGSSPWCEVAEQYLKVRAFKATDFSWYVTDETSYAGRLLIPYFFKDKIIYWQGRSLDDETIQPRYKNPMVEKSNIFFNMDEIYRYTNEPLFVTEGPIDAISIGKNAIALLGSTLTEFKRNELRKAATRRRVIFVIDKNLNGYKLGNNVLRDGEELEWHVTVFPDNIEDANDALQKLGRLFIATHLSSTACKGFKGKLLLELKCSKT